MKKVWKFQNEKNEYDSHLQKSFCHSQKKQNFSSELFDNFLIYSQPPKQFETWDGSLDKATKDLAKKKKKKKNMSCLYKKCLCQVSSLTHKCF